MVALLHRLDNSPGRVPPRICHIMSGNDSKKTVKKKRHQVESSSSDRTVDEIPRSKVVKIGKASSLPQTTSTSEWTSRDPLPMVNAPRIATANLASELREGELERLRVAFHIPEDVEIRVPGPEWKANRPPIGWICIFEDQLKGGLRFPIPQFVRDVLNFFRVPLAQVVLNGIRIVVRFLLL